MNSIAQFPGISRKFLRSVGIFFAALLQINDASAQLELSGIVTNPVISATDQLNIVWTLNNTSPNSYSFGSWTMLQQLYLGNPNINGQPDPYGLRYLGGGGWNLPPVLTPGSSLFASPISYVSANPAGFNAGHYSLESVVQLARWSSDGQIIVPGPYIARGSVEWDVVPKNIVVLTHGWRGSSSGLPEIKSAITDALPSLGHSLKDTAFIDFRWKEADTPFTSGDYYYAKSNVQQAGWRLAKQIQSIVDAGRALDSSYDPVIHFIGHSLGAGVNAEAVSKLSDSISVEQFTILDSPFREKFFHGKLLAGKVDYVDNYYSGQSGAQLNLFGAPITGANPCTTDPDNAAICQGSKVEWANHETIHSVYYVGQVESVVNWISPLASINSQAIWNPTAYSTSFSDPRIAPESIRALQGGVAPVLQNGVLSIRMTPHSPVEFEFDLAVPNAVDYLLFDISATPESLAEIHVYFNGTMIWTYYSRNMDSGSVTAEVDVASFAGGVGVFRALYVPQGILSEASIGGFRFAALTPVSEISTFASLLLGLMFLTILRMAQARWSSTDIQNVPVG